MTKRKSLYIIMKLISTTAKSLTTNGGVTQLVEYPVHTRSVTCSSQVAATRPVGQAVKTPPFHGGNMGSIPVRVTKKRRHTFVCLLFLFPSGIERLNATRTSVARCGSTQRNNYFLQSRKCKRFPYGSPHTERCGISFFDSLRESKRAALAKPR